MNQGASTRRACSNVRTCETHTERRQQRTRKPHTRTRAAMRSVLHTGCVKHIMASTVAIQTASTPPHLAFVGRQDSSTGCITCNVRQQQQQQHTTTLTDTTTLAQKHPQAKALPVSCCMQQQLKSLEVARHVPLPIPMLPQAPQAAMLHTKAGVWLHQACIAHKA